MVSLMARIDERMRALGLKQNEVERRLNAIWGTPKNKGLISALRVRPRMPEADKMAALARVLGVRTDWLVEGLGPMTLELPGDPPELRDVLATDEGRAWPAAVVDGVRAMALGSPTPYTVADLTRIGRVLVATEQGRDR